jgi:hypothetical protein
MVHVRKTVFAILLGMATLLLLAGCSENKSSTVLAPQDGTDEGALAQMMVDDQEIEGVDAWYGDDDQTLERGGGTLDEPVDPIRWGRIGRRQRETVNVEIQGDTLATITRICTFNGVFRLVTDTTGGTRTVVDKRMRNVIIRKAQAVRVSRTHRPRLNWRISGITPDVLRSAAPNPNTVWPVSVGFYRTVNGATELIAEVSDPRNTYFARDNLPALNPGEELIVRVQANVTGDVVAVLHPHAFDLTARPRLYLHDDGVAPDETAGDGVWSGSYVVAGRGGVFLTGVDLLDWETVHDTEAPYDATGWAIPYRVVRPQ